MTDGNPSAGDTPLGQALGVLSAILLVATIVGVLAFSQGVEREHRNQNPAAYAKVAKADAQSTCAGLEAAALFECVYEKVESSGEQARAEQDLNAQQGMEFWAAIMAALSLFTLIVTAIGICFVKRTLDATLAAVEETSKATRVMERQNAIAMRSQRPWLAVKIVSAQVLAKSLSFKLLIKNVGLHAASFRCDLRAYVLSDGVSLADRYPLKPATQLAFGAIAPTQELEEKAICHIEEMEAITSEIILFHLSVFYWESAEQVPHETWMSGQIGSKLPGSEYLSQVLYDSSGRGLSIVALPEMSGMD